MLGLKHAWEVHKEVKRAPDTRIRGNHEQNESESARKGSFNFGVVYCWESLSKNLELPVSGVAQNHSDVCQTRRTAQNGGVLGFLNVDLTRYRAQTNKKQNAQHQCRA